jgi:hypothetical protein
MMVLLLYYMLYLLFYLLWVWYNDDELDNIQFHETLLKRQISGHMWNIVYSMLAYCVCKP